MVLSTFATAHNHFQGRVNRALRVHCSLALFSNIKGSRLRRLPLMFEKSAKLQCTLNAKFFFTVAPENFVLYAVKKQIRRLKGGTHSALDSEAEVIMPYKDLTNA